MLNQNPFNRRKNTLRAIAKIAAIVAIILVPVIFAPNVLASSADPDGACLVTNIHVNRNLVSSGDMLVTGQYDIPYATLPTILASQAFTFSLLTTNGSSQLGYNIPYVYFNSGYNSGAFSFYFNPANAPTWGLAYIIRIAENPAQFTSPQHWDTTVPLAAYTSLTDQQQNQDDLASQVIVLAHNLETLYGVQLLTQSNAIVLSAGSDPNDGEMYFRGVIPSLQLMAPSLFLVQSAPVDLTSTNWTTTQFDSYEQRFDNTWVGNDVTTTSTQLGITPAFAMSVIVILPLCIGAIIFTSMKFRRAEPGYMVCSLVFIMGVLMGWLPKAIFASIYQACGIYIAYLWFFSRS